MSTHISDNGVLSLGQLRVILQELEDFPEDTRVGFSPTILNEGNLEVVALASDVPINIDPVRGDAFWLVDGSPNILFLADNRGKPDNAEAPPAVTTSTIIVNGSATFNLASTL